MEVVMSAESWMFDGVYAAHGRPIQVWIQYVGPGREDYNDPPSTRLADIPPEHLDIWNATGLAPDGDPAPDFDLLQEETMRYIRENERTIVAHFYTIDGFTPEWYWDT